MIRPNHASRFWAVAACTIVACSGLAVAQTGASTAEAGNRAAAAASQASVVLLPLAHAAEGQASLRLVLPGGASMDPPGASGLAHLINHALWDSAMDRLEARAADGDARASALLAAMGGRLHAHRAASLDMRATVYRIDLTGASDQTILDALVLLAEIRAGEGLDDPENLASAHARVLDELRGWTSPYLRVNQRATAALFAPLGLAPGPFVGRSDELGALGPDGLARMTIESHALGGAPSIIVTGDTGELTDDAVRAALAARPPRLLPMPRRPAAGGVGGSDAIVVRDPEVTFGVVELLRIERSLDAPGNTWMTEPGTPRAMREGLLRAAAAEALLRRIELAAESLSGDDSLSELVVMSKPFSSGVWLSAVHAMHAPGRWEHAMRVLTTEIRRVESHGYTEAEARLALTRALRDYESAARRENAETSVEAADRVAELLRAGEPVRTPAERARLAREAIAGVGAGDLREATVRAFGLREGSVALAATHDADASASESAVRLVITGARGLEPEAIAASLLDPASVESLLPRTVSDGRAAELRADPASGVLSVTLENNVVVHHREASPGGGAVTVEITVGGGEVDEVDGVPRGITDAALAAWRDAATATLTSRDVRDAIAGADLRVRAWSDHDLVRLSIRTSRDDLETALSLASALLREPRVEPAALERWRQWTLERASVTRTQPFDALRAAMWAPGAREGDPRVRMPREDEIRSITPELAQAWLDDLLARGSVEVAIVGDAPRAEVVRLATRLLSSVPDRPAIDPAPARPDAPSRGEGPMRADIDLDSLAGHAAALVGFVTDAGDDAFSWAIVDLTARALSPRIREALSGDRSVANEARAMFMPVEGWRGLSLCYTPMLIDSARLDAALDAAEGVYALVASEGVRDDELERARAGALRAIDADLADPVAWARALSSATRRGRPVDLLQRRREALLSVDAASIRREVSDALARGDAVRVVVRTRAPE